ncbi:MAG TPA: hypothetical protein VFB73_00325 [Chloroflexota bacterium]|nr:hypothetical protein [Chloroflexota bacterium]
MPGRRRMGKDLKVQQGKRRDAYFAHLRRIAQLRAAGRPSPASARLAQAE